MTENLKNTHHVGIELPCTNISPERCQEHNFARFCGFSLFKCIVLKFVTQTLRERESDNMKNYIVNNCTFNLFIYYINICSSGVKEVT